MEGEHMESSGLSETNKKGIVTRLNSKYNITVHRLE